jgi:hypothetical protein
MFQIFAADELLRLFGSDYAHLQTSDLGVILQRLRQSLIRFRSLDVVPTRRISDPLRFS